MTIIEQLAEFGTAKSALSAEVLHHTRRALLDWTAAAIPGAVEAPCQALERAFATQLDTGPCSLVLGRKALPTVAALINGTAAHTVEVDDIFKDAIYHPGAPTIAAALAAQQDSGASDEQLLRGIVVGYEISTRIGTALGREHYKYWHNTGTVGSFGATAAAASIYGLTTQQFAHALATVGTFAAGLQQAFRMDSMSKPLHSGRAAEAGVSAALMTREGMTGSLDILEGAAGIGNAMSKNVDWALATKDLGTVFNITRMTFKNHACCGHTFAAIDGALELKKQLGIESHQIASISIATYAPALEVAGDPDPQTAPEARFSLAFVVASALLYGSVRLAAFSDARLRDAGIRALMRKISLKVEPRLDAAFPKQRAALVSFHLTNGASESHLQAFRRGDPEAPLSDKELGEKFTELVEPVLGKDPTAALSRNIWARAA